MGEKHIIFCDLCRKEKDLNKIVFTKEEGETKLISIKIDYMDFNKGDGSFKRMEFCSFCIKEMLWELLQIEQGMSPVEEFHPIK